MSRKATMWVIRHSKSRVGSRLVLLAMARRADENGYVRWPGIRSICREAGISKSQLMRVLRNLVEIVEIKKRGAPSPGRSCDYQMVGFQQFLLTGSNMAPTGSRMDYINKKKEKGPRLTPQKAKQERTLWNALHVGTGPRAF
jgi:hypothetical protein